MSIGLWAESDGTIIVGLDHVDQDGNTESSETLLTFDASEDAEARRYAIAMSTAKAPDKWRAVPTTLPINEAL